MLEIDKVNDCACLQRACQDVELMESQLPVLREEKFQDLLRAWVEEWGAEYVILRLPERWGKAGLTVKTVSTDFCTKNTVWLSVNTGASYLFYAARADIS